MFRKDIFRLEKTKGEEMITKNKETIVKLQQEIRDTIKFAHSCLDAERVELAYLKRDLLLVELKATIQTSIEWCEDEIEFFKDNFYQRYNSHWTHENIENKFKELTTHLKWLKEQWEMVK